MQGLSCAIRRMLVILGLIASALTMLSGPTWSAQNLDLQRSMTPVKHQGSRNTCSVFAATSLMEYLLKQETGREIDLSEAYNYWAGKRDALKQSHLRAKYENMDGLAGFLAVEAYRSGSMLESVWPYEPKNWQQSNDTRCKIVQGKPATRCFTGVPPQSRPLRYGLSPVYVPRNRIGKFMLKEKKPVIMNVQWFSEAVNNQNGRVRMPTQEEMQRARSTASGHVITLVGYDPDKKEFKFRNSYGPDWGREGYGTIPESYIIEACEVCPFLQRLDQFPSKEKDFVLKASMGVTGTLIKLSKGDELPAEAVLFERALIRFQDPRLVYLPPTGTLQIGAAGFVLTNQKDWVIEKHSSSLYTFRMHNWKGFVWKINTSTGRLYRARHGEADKVIGKVTKLVGPASRPERIELDLRDAYIVYSPGTKVFQLVALGNVLSRGDDWRIAPVGAAQYHLARKDWRGFFWLLDTRREKLYKVTEGRFGKTGGQQSRVAAKVEIRS